MSTSISYVTADYTSVLKEDAGVHASLKEVLASHTLPSISHNASNPKYKGVQPWATATPTRDSLLAQRQDYTSSSGQ